MTIEIKLANGRTLKTERADEAAVFYETNGLAIKRKPRPKPKKAKPKK